MRLKFANVFVASIFLAFLGKSMESTKPSCSLDMSKWTIKIVKKGGVKCKLR